MSYKKTELNKKNVKKVVSKPKKTPKKTKVIAKNNDEKIDVSKEKIEPSSSLVNNNIQSPNNNIDYTQLTDAIDDITNKDDVNTLDYSTSLTTLNNTKKQNKHFGRLKTFLNNIYLDSQKQFKVVSLKSNLVKFSKFYINQNQKRRYLYVILLALLVSLLVIFLIQNSGLYSAGVGGLFQGMARIVQTALIKNNLNANIVDLVYNLIFWGLYLVVNIPLLIFSYKKISKQFAYLTTIYIFASQIFGFCLNLIPGISDIAIFGDTPSLVDNNLIAIKFASWNNSSTFCLLIYCIVAGILIGFPYSLLYIFGGSTGGTDVVSMYFAINKNKNIGTISTIANIICLIMAATIGSLSSILLWDQNLIIQNEGGSKLADNIFQAIFSPNLVFSIIMTSLTGIMINYLFPKMKFIKISIYTDDATQLKNKLSFSGYKHDIYFDKVENSTLNKESYCLETICMFVELPSLINSIRSIDKKSLIVVNHISSIDGEMFILK